MLKIQVRYKRVLAESEVVRRIVGLNIDAQMPLNMQFTVTPGDFFMYNILLVQVVSVHDNVVVVSDEDRQEQNLDLQQAQQLLIDHIG
jgi:hypothetical protein